jgi:predicted histone-like DNA-binding protein
MTIKYKAVERSRPGHPEVPAKYYPSLQATGRVTTYELAQEASDMCTLSTPDMVAAIEALLTLIPQHLADGEIVELGDLGEFWLYFSAEGIDDKNKVSGK